MTREIFRPSPLGEFDCMAVLNLQKPTIYYLFNIEIVPINKADLQN